MNFNKGITNILYERQLNSYQPGKFQHYKNKIYESLFDSKKLFKFKINLQNEYSNDIFFSGDGNFVVSGFITRTVKIWKINHDLSISTAYQEIKVDNYFRSIQSDSDFSKLYGLASSFFIFDLQTCKTIKKIESINAMNMSIDPKNENFLAFDDSSNYISILDQRCQNLQKIKLSDNKFSINSIEYHPKKNDLLLFASEKYGVFTFDLRNQKLDFQYNLLKTKKFNKFYAKYNKTGDQIIVSSKCLNPFLFNEKKADPCFEFSDLGYYNFFSTKKNCFAGINHEFVLSASDDFNVYLWEIPKKDFSLNCEENIFTKTISPAKIILKGHRSIVSDIIYNNEKCLIATQSWDSKIMLWSILPFGSNFELNGSYLSDDISHERTFDLTNHSGSRLSGENSLRTHILKTTVKDTLYSSKNKFSISDDFIDNFEELYLKFKTDGKFSYIKSLVFNYKNKGKKLHLKLITIIECAIEKELHLNHSKMDMQQLSYIFLVRKVFQTKYFLENFILYLKEQLELLEKLKKKIDEKKIKSISNLKLLLKIEFTMQSLLKDIDLILKENKILYQKSLYFYKHLILRVFELYTKNDVNQLMNDQLSDLNLFIQNIKL